MKYFGSMKAAAAAVFALAATCSYAITVTVNSTQPETATNFQTINAALAAVKASPDTEKNVHITGGGPYEEGFGANFSVTIKGQNYRPVIATQRIDSGAAAGVVPGYFAATGIAFWTSDDVPGPQTFKLENLTIIPALTNTSNRAIHTNNNYSDQGLNGEDMTLELNDVLITQNNGSNQPLTLTGLTETPDSTAPAYTTHAIYALGFINLTLNKTVISHHRVGTTSIDAVAFYPDGTGYTLNVGPGSVFSYNNRIGIQIAADGSIVNILGTEAEPVVFKGNHQNYSVLNGALSIYSDNENIVDNKVTLENVLFLENNAHVISQYYVTAGQSAPVLSAKNCAFVNNKGAAVVINDTLLAGQSWTFENCTFLNNGTAGAPFPQALYLGENTATPATGSILFKDSIIAGSGLATDGNGLNAIDIPAAGLNVTFQNTALVTAGPNNLDVAKYKLGSGVPAPTETAVITGNPEFVFTGTDFTNAGFLDVAAAAYATASSTGSALTGYGDYAGTSDVSEWTLY